MYGFAKKEIPILDDLHTNLKCDNNEKSVTLIVVDTHENENLFGYDLFKRFGFQSRRINSITNEDNREVSHWATRDETRFWR